MDRLIPLLICIIFLGACQQKKIIRHEVSFNQQPEKIRFVTSDVDLFWEMYDAELPLYTGEEVEEHYFNAGTPALLQFYEKKIQSPKALTTLLNSWLHRQYFESVRTNTLQIDDQKSMVMKAFNTFHTLYPEAVFTNVVFVIGALNTGGVVLPDGQIVIAAEMFGKTDDTKIDFFNSWLQSVLHKPDYLPVVIIHELVHLQQQQYAEKNNLPVGGRTLLDRALLEGSADFITHLVLDKFLTKQLLAFGNSKEEQLWQEFQQKMDRSDYGNWLYNGRSAKDQPADLGYYIGYKIAEYYYKNTENKKQAIKNIIQMKNGQSFLKASGYAGSFDQ